ncbi:beta-ketoacyl synthase N-terminal-like domain-containing protein [Streptomyces sp. NPDC005955]|uniref:beta-ketoacyl synthase N-terminal-like domain-containing protein n=1 Tax=Streptomyces sp. NPDC005955 TaxID=3364738 RepID=UPI0036962B08
MSDFRVGITGVGLALPGVDDPADLLRATTTGPAGEPVVPADRIGRKGLRYKDRATQLALVAVRDALRDSRLIPADGERCGLGAGTAVVASSNLGNLDTVCRTASAIATESVESISPMGLPNASSNVVASSVAIRFGLRGPNLMVCNGATSGLDTVRWAARLIRAGRAERAVVIGVETHNEVTEALTGHPAATALDGAVALVLEGVTAAERRAVPLVAELGDQTRRGSVDACVAALLATPGPTPGAWFTSEGFDGDRTVPGTDGMPRHALDAVLGHASGALGVAQCAAAVGLFTADGPGTVLLTNGDDDGDAVAGLLLRRTGEGGR